MIANKVRGFTLIELMVVLVIISILTAIALPLYEDYVIRSRITHALEGISERQTRMEQCYQDHPVQGYAYATCATAVENENDYFTFSLDGATQNTFTLRATGRGKMAPFVYTVDQANVRTTTITNGPSGWNASSTSCWITGKGGKC
ncbi:type IV minor pilin protein PilE [Betaproteobacteria bacterium]|nr:type IV minor pilin protein PilE [Betaproteobacteria bacterium]